MNALAGLKFTDRDLIEKIVESYFIVDYGFISKVQDNGTIDVVHAKKSVTMDGKELPETETHGIELLVFSCAEFSLKLTPKVGDNVLLLGLKNYVETASDIKHATKNDVFLHYQQNTMKAVPLALFNSEAKIKIQIDEGDLLLETDGNVTIKCNTAGIECDQAEVKCSGFKVSDSNGTAALEVTP